MGNKNWIRPRPDQRPSTTYTILTPAGHAHVTITRTEEHDPFEIFVEVGKAGSDLKAMAEALGRVCSLVLRMTADMPQKERARALIMQLQGIGGARQTRHEKIVVKSLPDGLARVLLDHYFPEVSEPSPIPGGETPRETGIKGADLCPACGDVAFVLIEGCQSCMSCGHSEC